MNDNKLNILWVNDNPVTAHNMILMYAINAKVHKWWDEVNVIIWGASAKLVCENKDIQREIKFGIENGVKFSACISCAENLGVTEDIRNIGIELKPWGKSLTEIIKSGEKLITI